MPAPSSNRPWHKIFITVNNHKLFTMSTALASPPKKKKKAAVHKASAVSKSPAKKKASSKDLSAGYNKFKEFNGKLYTGVQIGRGHHWNYDKGDWKETKITPDLWAISYAVTKRRVR